MEYTLKDRYVSRTTVNASCTSLPSYKYYICSTYNMLEICFTNDVAISAYLQQKKITANSQLATRNFPKMRKKHTVFRYTPLLMTWYSHYCGAASKQALGCVISCSAGSLFFTSL
jgi:hypothetical protein